MALSESDKQEILAMIRAENSQKQQKIMSSQNSFKKWLEVAAKHLLARLGEHLIEMLFKFVCNAFGIPC